MPSTRILLTGFGAFPGARSNPTVELVRRLAGSRRLARLGIAVEGRVLPVVFNEIEASLVAALAAPRPDAVIHLGLAARRRTLCVETRALNRLGPLRADAARRLAGRGIIRPGGPPVRSSRWPSARLVAAMNPAAPTRLSIDAGDYLCNQTLYLTLETTCLPTGFIHVPRPGRRGRADDRRRPSLAAMARAIEAALLVVAVEIRRRRT